MVQIGKNKKFTNVKNQAGQNFPTTNPSFVPPEPKAGDVTFNKDKTVDVRQSANSGLRMTKEEYNTSKGGSGAVTKNVQEATPDLPTAIYNKVVADRRLQALADLQPIEKPNIPQEAQTPISERVKNIEEKRNAELEQAPLGTKLLSKGYEKLTSNDAIATTLQNTANVLVEGSAILPESLRLGTKKSAGVSKAEQDFADLTATIDDQIELYKAGKKTYSQVQNFINLATEAIADLKSKEHGLGRLSVRYWLDRGNEIEKQVLRQEEILERQQLELNTAIPMKI